MQRLSVKMFRQFFCLLFFIILLGFPALAATDDALVDPGQITFREAVSDISNEQIDPYTGHLDLAYTDLHLPGNGGLNLQIIRTYKSDRVTDMATEESKLGYGWDIHFGKLKKKGTKVTVELQDGTSNTAVEAPAGSGNYLTKDFWKLSWPLGSSPVLKLTDGTKITFNKTDTIHGGFLATEIRKNNNAITIIYNTNETIKQVTYKAGVDSKTIQFNYAAAGKKHLQSITWGLQDIWGKPSRQIVYTYPADDKAIASVVLPGGDTWKYSYQLQYLNLRSAYILKTITTPWGGTVAYDFATFGKTCGMGVKTQAGVSRKQVSGRGLEKGSWSYNYKVESGYDSTVITESTGRITTHKFYGYGSASSYIGENCYKYGMPMSKTVMNGAVQEEATTYQWNKLSAPLSTMTYIGFCLCQDTQTYVPVMTSKKIIRGGNTYTTSYSNFDAFGSPRQIVGQGSNTRTKTLSYWYDTARNMVKDKPLTITTTGDSQLPGTFTTSYSYSSDANSYGETKTAEPNGVRTAYNYDTNGNISAITDANSHTTTFLWDHGTVSKITNPYYSIQRAINWDGTVASVTNGRGYTTSYQYDAAMRPTAVTPPVGNPTTTAYEYDGSGFFTSKNEQRGSVYTRTLYDGLGRQTGTGNALGVTTGIAYTPCGLKKSTSTNIGDTILFDPFGRPTLVTHQDATKRIYAYPDDSHLQVTDEDNFVQHYYFQSFGNPADNLLFRVVDAKNQETVYSYNSLGSLIEAQGNGRTDSYGYDTKNFLTLETHPESGTIAYGRDEVGNIKDLRDSLGTRYWQYDSINRLLSVSTGSETRSYTYDNANNMVTAASPDSSMSYVYDTANRLTRITASILGDTSRLTEYSYDNNDNRTQVKYPTGLAAQYQYNSLNQITGISGFGGSVTGIAYHATAPKLGLLRQYTYSNGRTTTLDYTARRTPLYIDSAVFKQTYGYDNRGNLKTLTDPLRPSRNKTFSYDQLDRMTGFSGPWGVGSFEYSAGGDRTTRILAGQIATYSYSSNLLQSGAGRSFAYNGDGDLTSISQGGVSSDLEYDPFHRLRTYTKAGTTLAEFGYDAHGGRAYKTSGGRTISYFADNGNGNILSETLDVGTPTNYVYLGNTLVAKLHAFDPNLPAEVFPISFYHTDPYGTPHVLTGSNGAIIWHGDYFPFGQEYDISTGKTVNKKRFIGKEKDAETGLDYFGARYMDETVGRFVSGDPVGLVDAQSGKVNEEILSDPQRLNRYAYGLNNPYKYADRDGKFAVISAEIAEIKAEALRASRESARTIRMASDIAVAVASEGMIQRGGGRVPRFQGNKPSYHVNEAHVPGSRFNTNKEPLPVDAAAVYKNAVPDAAEGARNWYGKNATGTIYRFSDANDGTAHFSGSSTSKDGIRNITTYAKIRLEGN